MKAPLAHAFVIATLVGAGALSLSACEMVVNLDRSEVEAGPPNSCPICTELPDDAGDAEGLDGSDDGGDAGPVDAGIEGGPADSAAGG